MNRLRQTGSIFLVIMVLFSTTGFTLWHHICACQPVKEVHSCCPGDMQEPVKTNDACGTGCAHDHKGCKDIPVYYKASIVAISLNVKVVPDDLSTALEIELPFISEHDNASVNNILPVYKERPPPRAGRDLVFYLHQIRIPFSA